MFAPIAPQLHTDRAKGVSSCTTMPEAWMEVSSLHVRMGHLTGIGV